MKVLFLDIDGVLNSARTLVARGGYPMELTGHHLDMFDTIAVGLVRSLCEKANVSVVVSSAWRITHHVDAIGRALDLPTIDRTPSLSKTRGHEIADWLAKHPQVTRYAIVDDDSDMLPEQLPYFVKTDGNEGLSFANYIRLCEIFSVNVYDCAPVRMREGNTTKLVGEDGA
jgi:hypothetical protein